MGRVDYDTWTWWYGSIPSAIILADPCDLIWLSIIVTDVDCSRSIHGSTIADNTTRDGCVASKSSVYASLIHCFTLNRNFTVSKVCHSALCMSQIKTYDCVTYLHNFDNTDTLKVHVCLRVTIHLCALKLHSFLNRKMQEDSHEYNYEIIGTSMSEPHTMWFFI